MQKAGDGLGWSETALGVCHEEVGEMEMVARLVTLLPTLGSKYCREELMI